MELVPHSVSEYGIINIMITGRKMLIVDDDTSVLKALTSTFLKNGFDVQTASNGEEGIAAISKEKPDIILLDILMPTMNGIKMLKKLRELPNGKNIPVIILTNSDLQNLSLNPAVKDAAVIMIKTNWSLKNIAEEVMSVLNK
jgi:CheY-like chemotaxis protein